MTKELCIITRKVPYQCYIQEFSLLHFGKISNVTHLKTRIPVPRPALDGVDFRLSYWIKSVTLGEGSFVTSFHDAKVMQCSRMCTVDMAPCVKHAAAALQLHGHKPHGHIHATSSSNETSYDGYTVHVLAVRSTTIQDCFCANVISVLVHPVVALMRSCAFPIASKVFFE